MIVKLPPEMLHRICGVRVLDFPGTDGKQVKGFTFHALSYEALKEGDGFGRTTESFFIGFDKFFDLFPGMTPAGLLDATVLCIRNPKGKISSAMLAEPANEDVLSHSNENSFSEEEF